MIEDIKETRLSNGLVVLTDRMAGVRSATLGFFFRTGARHEPIELHGISHFIEHAVFKGTSTRSALDIAIEQDRLGGNLDAFTTHEEVGFAIKVIDDHLAQAFNLIADMLTSPRFEETDLEAEQRVIIEEMKMIDDSPEEYLGEIFSNAFFPDNPLGRSIAGTPTSVRSFDRETTRTYHERVFHAGDLVIAAAGNVDHDELLKMAEQAGFGEPVGGNGEKSHPASPTPAAPLIIKQRPDLEQAHLIIATPFVGAADERRYAADLLGNIMGGGTSSRLWQKVREERGLAYSVSAGSIMYQDCGLFSIGAATSPEHVRQVVELSIAEMQDVAASGITHDELDLVKQQAVSSVLLSLEDSSSRSAALAQSEMVHGRQVSVEETLAGIRAVSVEDCRSIAEEFFRSENIAFAGLGDLHGVEIDRARLGGLSK